MIFVLMLSPGTFGYSDEGAERWQEVVLVDHPVVRWFRWWCRHSTDTTDQCWDKADPVTGPTGSADLQQLSLPIPGHTSRLHYSQVSVCVESSNIKACDARSLYINPILAPVSGTCVIPHLIWDWMCLVSDSGADYITDLRGSFHK